MNGQGTAITVDEAIDLIREATDGVIEGVRWIRNGERWLCRLHTGWVGIEENKSLYLPIMKRKDMRSEMIRDDLLEISNDKNIQHVNLLALAAIEEFRRELEAIPGAKRQFAGEAATDSVKRRLKYVVEFPASAVNEPGTLEIIIRALQNLSERIGQEG